MLLPEPMSRILVVGTKRRLPDTIDLLYSLENVHVVDFPADEEGFSLGAPLPAASDASHKLLKLRSMEKDLDIDEAKHPERVPVSTVRSGLDATIAELEGEVAVVVESRHAKQAKLAEAESRLAQLEPFRSIPLDIEMYGGYTSLDVLAGYVRSDPQPLLRDALHDEYELFTAEGGDFVVLFVPLKHAEEALRVLGQSGFVQTAVPTGNGRPQEMATALEGEIATAKQELEAVDERLAQLNDKHAKTVLASDEYLSIEVEKAELPLRMGASAHSFVLEAWVPTASYDAVAKAFADKLGDSIHIELLENKSRVEHHADEDEIKMEGGMATAEAVALPMSEEPPVKLEHGGNVGRFEFFTKLLSTPRYNEIDPTITVAIFFPMFFGLMVGDVGYGIPFTVLGLIGLRRCQSPEWRGISTMLFYGGLWSIFFGLFLFGDMMGIEFTSMHAAEGGHEEGGMWATTWAALLGIDIPHTLFSVGGFDVNLGYFTKLGSVEILLYLSLWIGVAHLILGLFLGFYNVAIRHGVKHAFMEKGSWLMIMFGFAVLLPVIIDVLIRGNALEFTSPMFLAGIGLFVAGLLLALVGEGGKAMVELPEVASNVLSYTRLIAIGMSKAGMALAFNYIALGLIVGVGTSETLTTDPVMLIAALLIFIVGHLMIFILAIISAGLHGIRLQYVELFKKFYEGGGAEFDPLRIKRKHTVEE